MKKRLESIIKSLARIFIKPRARRTTAALLRKTGSEAGPLLAAIRESLDNDTPPEEAAWIGRIEALRRQLDKSKDLIEIVDFGAGKSSDHRSEDEMHRGAVATRRLGQLSRSASSSPFWGLLLFKLIRAYRPCVCIELGTFIGISAAYQAAALRLNGSGRLVTLEGSEAFASLAAENLHALGLDNTTVVTGRFQDTLQGVLREHNPVDYISIDGHHDEQATVAYFQQVRPFLSDRAVLVFDDICWNAGMKRAWDRIVSDEVVKISVNMRNLGICIVDDGVTGKTHHRIPMI